MNDANLPTIEQLLEAADRKVKELVRAIHCLPKPPEGMGDGPDERVANVIFLLQQARAEVLAACQGVVEVFIQEMGEFSQQFAKWRPFKKWDRDDWEAAGLRLLTDVQDALEKVQPAAKDLGELLREAELEGLKFAFNAAYEEQVEELIEEVVQGRIAELEKARTISKEKS